MKRDLKNFKLIIAVLLVLFVCVAAAPATEVGGKKMPAEYNCGSADVLSGDMYVLSCFVSADNTEWTANEKKEALAALSKSQSWLQKQAKRYNAPLTFTGGSFGQTADIKNNDIGYGTACGNERVDVISEVLTSIGYDGPRDFYKWVLTNTTCTKTYILLFVKGKGISYSMPYTKRCNPDVYFVEGSVIYSHDPEGHKLNESDIAHETLHLFGAWDLYETFEQTAKREARARELYPNDIMLRTSYNINELEVSELSAWAIGWNNNYKPIFNWFKP